MPSPSALTGEGGVAGCRVIAGILLGLATAITGCHSPPLVSQPQDATEQRVVQFLQREVPAWHRDNGCFSCHNNGDAARALYRASRLGYALPKKTLADTTRWVSQPDRWDHNQGDPGVSDLRLADLQFAATLTAARESGIRITSSAMHAAGARLLKGQATDGSWPVDEGNAVGSPATHGTALATLVAFQTLNAMDSERFSDARIKAKSWLERLPIRSVIDASVVLLAANELEGSPRTREAVALLARSQGSEGGWGPYANTPPEPFDTAVALLALATRSNEPDISAMISRGRAFLASTQNPDGSWPATTRPPRGISYAQQMSTTGWAAQALLVTRPP